jgi:hypothetical protein
MRRTFPLFAAAASTALALLAGCSGAEDRTEPATGADAALQLEEPVQVHRWSDPAAPIAFSAPAGAHLNNYGGRVVSNLQVVQVLWGSGNYLANVSSTSSPSMATFYQGVLNSPYIDWLTEYNTSTQSIGRGHFVGQYRITPSTSATAISDATIKAELSNQIAAGHLPAPTADARGNNNTYYAVFFPHGFSITQGSYSSCVPGGFCAYHGTIANAGGHEVYYGVHPDMQAGSGCDTGCGASAPFGNNTSVASHEMVETITDAEVGLAAAVGAPLAWYDPTYGEIGDICNAQQSTIVGGDGVTYTVQKEFSNRANDCIVSRATTTGLTASPSSVALSGHGGLDYLRNLTISNGGPGAVTGIKVLITRTSGTVGSLDIASNNCTSLAAGASCTVQIDFGSGCPFGGTSHWNVNVTGTGGSVVVPVTGSSAASICL